MTSRLGTWLLASPPAEWALSQLRQLLIAALRQGPVPRHIAFVMDGNRRYARGQGMETIEGHHLGFEALAKILEVCYKARVTHVTIYAFSIENFKRSKYEVDALMDLATVKMTQISQHGGLMDRYGASIRVLGRRDLLKPDVVAAIDKAVAMTSHNSSAVLNICFPYTSRDEITTAVRTTVEDWSRQAQSREKLGSPFKEARIAQSIRSQKSDSLIPPQPLSPSSSSVSLSSSSTDSPSVLSSTSTLHQSSSHPTSDDDSLPKPTSTSTTYPAKSKSTAVFPSPESITPSTLDTRMFTGSDPPVDLLVRTSNVHRLSDFMLWQCHQDTDIAFLDVLWPRFDLYSFLPVLWEWQWRQKKRLDAEGQKLSVD